MSNSSDTRSSSADRELAEPLLVEHRQGADPRPRLVEQRSLGDDRLVHLRLSAEDDHRRPSVTGEVEQRRPVARARAPPPDRARRPAGAGPLGHPVELVERGAPRSAWPATRSTRLALAPRGHLVGGRSGAHHRPRHDRERTAEDDEAGQQRVAGRQLHDGDGAGRHADGRDRALPRLPHVTPEVRQPETVERRQEDQDVRDRPRQAGSAGDVVPVAPRVQRCPKPTTKPATPAYMRTRLARRMYQQSAGRGLR